jgi:hypothetical protein
VVIAAEYLLHPCRIRFHPPASLANSRSAENDRGLGQREGQRRLGYEDVAQEIKDPPGAGDHLWGRRWPGWSSNVSLDAKSHRVPKPPGRAKPLKT